MAVRNADAHDRSIVVHRFSRSGARRSDRVLVEHVVLADWLALGAAKARDGTLTVTCRRFVAPSVPAEPAAPMAEVTVMQRLAPNGTLLASKELAIGRAARTVYDGEAHGTTLTADAQGNVFGLCDLTGSGQPSVAVRWCAADAEPEQRDVRGTRIAADGRGGAWIYGDDAELTHLSESGLTRVAVTARALAVDRRGAAVVAYAPAPGVAKLIRISLRNEVGAVRTLSPSALSDLALDPRTGSSTTLGWRDDTRRHDATLTLQRDGRAATIVRRRKGHTVNRPMLAIEATGTAYVVWEEGLTTLDVCNLPANEHVRWARVAPDVKHPKARILGGSPFTYFQRA